MHPASPHVDADTRILGLLDQPCADEELRDALLDLGQPWSPALCSLVGPVLYRRNPIVFRSLLLAQLESGNREPNERRFDPWRGQEAAALAQWLEVADAADDVEMFRALYAWRSRSLPPDQREAQWRKDVARQFLAADSHARRTVVLEKLSSGFTLDEPTAIKLFETDPKRAPSFIRRHMASASGLSGAYWAALSSLARQRHDQELFFAIYRRTVEVDQWARDVDLLASRIETASELVVELVRRDPDVSRSNACSVLYSLLKKRGEDVVPYAVWVIRRGGDGLAAEPARHTDLIRLADERGWLELWSILLVASRRGAEVDREVRRLIEDQRREEVELLRRLDVIARFATRHGGPAAGAALTLSDETAVKTYARFPSLLRDGLRRCLRLGPHGYPRLLNAAVANQDETLTDYLASLVVVVDMGLEWARREAVPMAETLRANYEALGAMPAAFAARAARVFGFVAPQAGPASGYAAIAAGNELTSLFWNAPSSIYLANPAAIRDLLESAEAHAQQLGFRILAVDDALARTLAAQNLELLEAAPLRRLPRRVLLTAFQALENAGHDLAVARRVVTAVRNACDLPDRGYPKEHLIALLGRILHRHPSLQSEVEQRLAHAGVNA